MNGPRPNSPTATARARWLARSGTIPASSTPDSGCGEMSPFPPGLYAACDSHRGDPYWSLPVPVDPPDRPAAAHDLTRPTHRAAGTPTPVWKRYEDPAFNSFDAAEMERFCRGLWGGPVDEVAQVRARRAARYVGPGRTSRTSRNLTQGWDSDRVVGTGRSSRPRGESAHIFAFDLPGLRRWEYIATVASLEDKEYEAVQLALQGCSEREIARLRGVDKRTVANRLHLAGWFLWAMLPADDQADLTRRFDLKFSVGTSTKVPRLNKGGRPLNNLLPHPPQ